MLKDYSTVILVVLICISSRTHFNVSGFHVTSRRFRFGSASNNRVSLRMNHGGRSSDNCSSSSSPDKNPHFTSQDVDGTDRGISLQILAIFVCLWLFSIPPEFRRSHFCFTDLCVAHRSRCYDCVTVSEWTNKVKEYYQNGGGIQFDFSIGDDAKSMWNPSKT
jgi:hypothetical protein